jgi:hypothetical protein
VSKKSKAAGITIHDFKLCHRTIITKPLSYWHKNGHQWLTPVILATQEAKTRTGKYFLRPYHKKNSQKRTGGMTQGVGCFFKPQYRAKKKKKKRHVD